MAEINKNEPKDCQIAINILTKNTEADIFITAPENGGCDVTMDALLAAIKRNSIVYGIKNDVLSAIVRDKLYNQQLCIAEALMPVNGENGDIRYNYEKHVERVPVLKDDGTVDYRNLNFIREVHAGDIIAEIKLPTSGKSGTDVRGMVMNPIIGKKAVFNVGTNTYLTEDGTKIISQKDGRLVYGNSCFNVETTVTIQGDVDSSIGNLSFTGDIIVKGNILEGFKVSSNSNILVMGNCTGAEIECVGNVVIKKGCIHSTVTAHGTVEAQFCEHSTIKCDTDLKAFNYLLCDIYCGGALCTKITKSTSCGIVGGRYTSLSNIETFNIGSKSYVATEITLGDNALLAEERLELVEKVTKLEKELSDLTLVVNFLNEKKKELHHLPAEKELILGNTSRQKIITTRNLNEMTKRINEINFSLQNKEQLSITCKGYVYPGTIICINDLTLKIDREYSKCLITPDETGTEIVVKPL